MARKANVKVPKPIPQGESFETFGYPRYDVERMMMVRSPRVVNGEVSARRYRVTVQLIYEPIEAIRARLIELWANADNMHHSGPLQEEAKRYGLDLMTCGVSRGSAVKRTIQ